MPDPVLAARGRLANASRQGGDPAKRDAARRALTAAKLERHIRAAVAAAPPLTTEQRDALARLLTVGGGSA